MTAAGLVLFSTSVEANRIGLEPERLTVLLEAEEGWEATDEHLAEIDARLAMSPTAQLWYAKGLANVARGQWNEAESAFRQASRELAGARLGLAIALAQLDKSKEALDVLETPSGPEDYRAGFARAILKLRSERDVQFSDLREELIPILSQDPSRLEVFEVWLGLNPEKKELEDYLKRLKPLQTPEAVWQRAEILLRLDKADRALKEIQKLDTDDGDLRDRLDYARARAFFQIESDAAGQAVYGEILDRLDETSAEILYRDIAALVTQREAERYQTLAIEQRADFFRRFWKERDPVPVREVNPRLAEHYRRLARALAEYPLQSTGNGYFTDRDEFLRDSPEAPYYDSTVVFEKARDTHYWLDHRGVILLQHGEPDLKVGPRRYGSGHSSESWIISRARSRPYLFNFVKRPDVDEYVLALNLGVAATSPVAPDDPTAVLESITRDYSRLYMSRVRMHPIYRAILEARSRVDLERGLRAEHEQMASFVKAAMALDSTSYYTRENTLPMAVSVSNFYSEGLPGIDVDFAVDLSVLDLDKLNESSTLEATVLVYDKEWKEVLTQVDNAFSLWPPPSGKAKTFVGNLQVLDLDPNQYRLVLQINQPDTGRIGIARGQHQTMYVRAQNLGLSDLYLRQLPVVQDKGKKVVPQNAPWLPAPGRVIRRQNPSKIEFDLYNLSADEAGTARYEIEERILTLYKNPGILSQIAGYGNMAGQMFFPFYTFVAQAGTFALSQALASETKGIEVQTRTVERPAEPTLKEAFQMDLTELKPGIYTVYITVRDLVSNEISSRFLTLQVS
jgi:GWxTD domain-containing protein